MALFLTQSIGFPYSNLWFMFPYVGNKRETAHVGQRYGTYLAERRHLSGSDHHDASKRIIHDISQQHINISLLHAQTPMYKGFCCLNISLNISLSISLNISHTNMDYGLRIIWSNRFMQIWLKNGVTCIKLCYY